MRKLEQLDLGFWSYLDIAGRAKLGSSRLDWVKGLGLGRTSRRIPYQLAGIAKKS